VTIDLDLRKHRVAGRPSSPLVPISPFSVKKACPLATFLADRLLTSTASNL